jgi:hypothetical protein
VVLGLQLEAGAPREMHNKAYLGRKSGSNDTKSYFGLLIKPILAGQGSYLPALLMWEHSACMGGYMPRFIVPIVRILYVKYLALEGKLPCYGILVCFNFIFSTRWS